MRLCPRFKVVNRVLLVLLATVLCRPAYCGEIHDAAKGGDLERVKTLISGNPNLVSSKDTDGATPLHWAAFFGHKAVAELLLSHSADINAKTGDGTTPLHWAAREDAKDVAELLIANKADINSKDDQGDTPLHMAAMNGQNDVVVLLLTSKADVNAKDNNGATPLSLAVQHERTAAAAILRRAEAGQRITPVANEPSPGKATLLEPFKAILRDKVSCQNNDFNWGYAVPKNADDTLVAIYFRGFSETARISSDDLKWLVKHEKHGNVGTIGLFAATADSPLRIIGVVPPAGWVSLQGATSPLLSLVFVVPKGAKELVLTDPTGATHKVAISDDWSPKQENFINSYRVSQIQFLGPQNDDLWTTQ